MRRDDPLGKRAVFAPDVASAPAASGSGKRALYSPPGAQGSGPLTAECGECRSRRRMWPVEAVVRQLPLPLWLPRGRYDHRLRCGPCGRRTWHSVTWRRA